ncbi:hypothetical protein GN958_ATG21288 [Phytophthora infestans]|uniref:Uncharacterized protein n=1 Tax=Phytophthora infestans TaxID=4787 RepID=A0A8S9TPG1_PHYIN|nr:hypothetical protein GN958_ATG21288 [Phytophthora infestans]
MECDNTRKFTINECGEHNSLEKDTKKNKLTEAHKTYIREMAAQGLRPGRIRNAMPRKFNVRMDDLPELKVVQISRTSFARPK